MKDTLRILGLIILASAIYGLVDYAIDQFYGCTGDLLDCFSESNLAKSYESIYLDDLRSDGYTIQSSGWTIHRQGQGCVFKFSVQSIKFGIIRPIHFTGDAFYVDKSTGMVSPLTEGAKLILDKFGGSMFLPDNSSTIVRPGASSTHRPAVKRPTPTSEPDCFLWSEVDISDVGQDICVYGYVLSAYQTDEAYFIAFGPSSTDFFLLSYDLHYPDIKTGACVVASGKVKRLGLTPVIVLSQDSLLVECP
jgi:hypothetical protein